MVGFEHRQGVAHLQLRPFNGSFNRRTLPPVNQHTGRVAEATNDGSRNGAKQYEPEVAHGGTQQQRSGSRSTRGLCPFELWLVLRGPGQRAAERDPGHAGPKGGSDRDRSLKVDSRGVRGLPPW